mgnify:CR=1 FL=1
MGGVEDELGRAVIALQLHDRCGRPVPLEIEESDSKPSDYEFSVPFDGRYYSVRKYPVSQGMVPSWNQEAFAVLSNLFQMTVTDLTKYPTPAIAIAK